MTVNETVVVWPCATSVMMGVVARMLALAVNGKVAVCPTVVLSVRAVLAKTQIAGEVGGDACASGRGGEVETAQQRVAATPQRRGEAGTAIKLRDLDDAGGAAVNGIEPAYG